MAVLYIALGLVLNLSHDAIYVGKILDLSGLGVVFDDLSISIDAVMYPNFHQSFSLDTSSIVYGRGGKRGEVYRFP